jgi:RES domain-containing protein
MRLWRVSNYASLSGEGGLRAAGRWNARGQRVVYLAEHPALAVLEMIVHLRVDQDDPPVDYRLLTVDGPDDLLVDELRQADLDARSPEWRNDESICRSVAASFFELRAAPLLRVPSVLVPQAFNYVLNPEHSDGARLSIVGDERFPLNRRLIRSLPDASS